MAEARETESMRILQICPRKTSMKTQAQSLGRVALYRMDGGSSKADGGLSVTIASVLNGVGGRDLVPTREPHTYKPEQQ